MQPRESSVFFKAHFSVSSSSLLIFITVLSSVGNTLTTSIERIQTPNPLNQDNTMVPLNFPENSTRSVVTASEDLLKKIRNTIPSEAEDMLNTKVDKSNATIDRNDEESPLSKENVNQVTTSTTLLTNNNDSKTSDETTTILSTTNYLTTLNETTTTTEITISSTTLAADNITTTTIYSTTLTNIPTTTTITTTTIATTEVTDPPETQTEESSAFIEENEKMPSGIIVLVTMITFAIVAVIGYVSLIVWRRYLEYRYGNRELLVNDLEFDTNDLRHFEL